MAHFHQQFSEIGVYFGSGKVREKGQFLNPWTSVPVLVVSSCNRWKMLSAAWNMGSSLKHLSHSAYP